MTKGLSDKFGEDRIRDPPFLKAPMSAPAAALAMREWPQFSGAFEVGVFEPASNVHVGWAIAHFQT